MHILLFSIYYLRRTEKIGSRNILCYYSGDVNFNIENSENNEIGLGKIRISPFDNQSTDVDEIQFD